MEIEWPLVFYTLLTGLGVGAFAFVAVTEWWGKAERTRLPGAITALVAIAAGAVASLFHLGHPERLLNVLPPRSGIGQELILMGLTALVFLVYIVLMRVGYSAQVRKIVATLGLVLGVVLAFVNGNNYVLPARPAWNTLLLPLLYLTSAAVLGLFTMYIWTAVREKEAPVVMAVNKAALIAVIVEAAVTAGYVAFLAVAPHPDPSRSPAILMSGDLAVAFWVGVILLGLVIPLGLTAFLTAKKRVISPLAVPAVALACVIVGAIAIRALLYILGTSIEVFA